MVEDYEEKRALAQEAAQRVRGSGQWRRTRCPFCPRVLGSEDRRGNWCLNTHTGGWVCKRCATTGWVPGFASHDDLGRVSRADREMFATPTAAALHKLPEGYRSLLDSDEDLKPARQYVAKRQVTKKVAKSAKLGAVLTDFESTNDDPDEEVRKAAQKAAFMSRGRVIAPIYDAAEKGLEGWSGRLYVKPRPGSRAPKVLYSDAIARARVLYNAAALYQPSDTPVLLVEGVFDALPYFPDVAAFLGKPSPGQVEVLLGSSRPVVVCLDGDSWLEGEMLGRRLMFEGRNNVAWVKLPPTLDPNDVDANWLREEARRALAGV